MREGVRMMGRGGGNLEERAASCELRAARCAGYNDDKRWAR